MRKLITLIAVVVGVSRLCLAQTLDSEFVFSLSSSRGDLSFYYQLAVAEATASFRGDANTFVFVSPRRFASAFPLVSGRGYVPLSNPLDFHGEYDPFPIFPLPRSADREASAIEAFVVSTW